MTDYTKTTNFTVKDTLVAGNPAKIIRGSEFDTEFNNIQVSVATKANISSPSFTGDVTAADGNFVGPLVGNVTGDVTGNVVGNLTGNSTGLHTGNVVGNVTGDLTGNVTGNVVGNVTGTASNADRLDSLDSTQFLRSDVSDTFTNLTGSSLTSNIITDNVDGTGNLVFERSGSEKMRLTSDGKLGIGTISPTEDLDLQNIDLTKFRVRSLNSSFSEATDISIETDHNSKLATIKSSGTSPVDLAFSTNFSERMRLTSDGALLVGTTSSLHNSNFTILDTQEGKLEIRNNSNVVRGKTSSLILQGSSNVTDRNVQISCVNGDSVGENNLTFSTNKDGVGNTEKMRLTSDGKLGVGLTNPTQKIHTSGNIKADGIHLSQLLQVARVKQHSLSQSALNNKFAWVDIIEVKDTQSVEVTISSFAHSSIKAVVINGGAANSTIDIVSSFKNNNQNFANIDGLRFLNNRILQAKFIWTANDPIVSTTVEVKPTLSGSDNTTANLLISDTLIDSSVVSTVRTTAFPNAGGFGSMSQAFDSRIGRVEYPGDLSFDNVQISDDGIALVGNKMTLTSSGYLKVDPAGSYLGRFNNNLEADQTHNFVNPNDSINLRVETNNAGSRAVQLFTGLPSNSTSFHIRSFTASTEMFAVAGDGTVRNVNQVIASGSDIKLKENIQDATPKLEDINKIRFVNFDFKANPELGKQFGVIAQELEEIFPNLIINTPDTEEVEVTDEEGNVTTETIETGEVTKSVKYSILTLMAVKALQELKAEKDELEATVQSQQSIIDSLLARVEALESK